MKKGEEARGIISEYRFPDRGYIVREDGKVLVKHAGTGSGISRDQGAKGECGGQSA